MIKKRANRVNVGKYQKRAGFFLGSLIVLRHSRTAAGRNGIRPHRCGGARSGRRPTNAKRAAPPDEGWAPGQATLIERMRAVSISLPSKNHHGVCLMHPAAMFRPLALLRHAAATLTLIVAPCLASAQFALQPLPYPSDALEPFIDQVTMEIHHGRHHKAYVDNLNAQIEQAPELAALSLDTLQGQISRFSTAVRNNGGGHYNHTLFWDLMAPEGQRGAPEGALLADIVGTFGSLEALQTQFEAAALGRFGSGWAWLIVTPAGELVITSTPNQDNPLMDLPGIVRGTPILALDVWEHAYYLKYQNRRGEYADLWWNVVNWNEVGRRHAAAQPARQP